MIAEMGRSHIPKPCFEGIPNTLSETAFLTACGREKLTVTDTLQEN